MERIVSNITIENVGDLRAFLSVLPDDMPTSDHFGDALHLEITADTTTGDKRLEIA